MMSALPPKADIAQSTAAISAFSRKANILRCIEERRYSITSSAMESAPAGIVALAIAILVASEAFATPCPQQLRQLGDIRCDPSRLIFAEQLGCGTAAGTDLALVANSAA